MSDKKIGVNPKGISGRMWRQKKDARDLGLPDPYKKKKRKSKSKLENLPLKQKKKGIRHYLLGKFPKYKKLMEALD